MVDENYNYAQDLNQDPLNDAGQSDPGVDDNWDGATPTELVAAETAEGSYGGSTQNRFIQKGSIIIMLACLLGVGAIYFFSLRNKPQEATENDKEVEAKVDKVLARLTNEDEKKKSRDLFEHTQEMVERFYAYPAKQQVALGELKRRDPFDLPFAKTDGEIDPGLLRSQQKKELEKRLAGVKLQSIIQGPQRSKCLLNGEVYDRGDTVLTIFEVKEIGEETVILTANDFDFTLSM